MTPSDPPASIQTWQAGDIKQDLHGTQQSPEQRPADDGGSTVDCSCSPFTQVQDLLDRAHMHMCIYFTTSLLFIDELLKSGLTKFAKAPKLYLSTCNYSLEICETTSWNEGVRVVIWWQRFLLHLGSMVSLHVRQTAWSCFSPRSHREALPPAEHGSELVDSSSKLHPKLERETREKLNRRLNYYIYICLFRKQTALVWSIHTLYHLSEKCVLLKIDIDMDW